MYEVLVFTIGLYTIIVSTVIFWVMTLYGLVGSYQCFSGDTAQETTIDNFSAVRTSNHTYDSVVFILC